MNTSTRLSIGILTALFLFSARTSIFFAQGAVAPAPNSPPPAPANPAALISMLQQAYTTLAAADHDYHGHRDLAMKDIATAATLLGADFSGMGHGGEPQKLSDLQIRSVQMMLLGVGRGAPDGPNHKEIVSHINSAIRQLTDALESETPGKPGAPHHGGVIAEDPVGTNSLEVSSLERVYEVLSLADHDYKGKRAQAMRSISKACKALGGNITGDGHAKENQASSDEQLHQAEFLLEQVRGCFAANDPKKVLKDLNSAVVDLSAALSVK